MFNNKPRKKRNKSKKRRDVKRKEETIKYNQAQKDSIVKGNGIANFLRAHSNHGASCLSRFSFRYLSLTKFPFRSGGNKAYSKQRLAVYMHTALSVLVFKCLSRWNKILIPNLALSLPLSSISFCFPAFFNPLSARFSRFFRSHDVFRERGEKRNSFNRHRIHFFRRQTSINCTRLKLTLNENSRREQERGCGNGGVKRIEKERGMARRERNESRNTQDEFTPFNYATQVDTMVR